MTTKTAVDAKTILLVESEAAFRETLKDNLVAAGFTVFEARTGTDGYRMAINYRPDIILLAVLLPGMDGIEIMRKLRKDPWGRHVPIMLVTSVSPNQRIIQGVVEGRPVFYLEKAGWSIGEMVDKVRLLAFYSPLFKKRVTA